MAAFPRPFGILPSSFFFIFAATEFEAKVIICNLNGLYGRVSQALKCFLMFLESLLKADLKSLVYFLVF